MRLLQLAGIAGLLILNCSGTTGQLRQLTFSQFLNQFQKGYQEIHVPEFQYDYADYFLTIPDLQQLNRQNDFLSARQKQLLLFDRDKLTLTDRLTFDQLHYEMEFQLQRLQLEREWLRRGRVVPEMGYFDSVEMRGWYEYFVQKFTGLHLTPEAVLQFGLQEVERISQQVDSMQSCLHFDSRKEMYAALNHDSFFYTVQQDLADHFFRIDSIARLKLNEFCGVADIPVVHPIQWPGANAHTPPGMYLNHTSTAYGKDVFWYNFYGNRFPKRFGVWLYLHEAIPGHHVQADARNRQSHSLLDTYFIYPGTFEGWACYAEHEGIAMGLYSSPLNYLGLLEWNLIRAVRVVLDAEIHHYGWSTDKAREYWKQNIYGLDDRMEREISRVVRWPGQALSYQLGADAIRKMFNAYLSQRKTDRAKLRKAFLNCGMLPISVIRKNMGDMYEKI